MHKWYAWRQGFDDLMVSAMKYLHLSATCHGRIFALLAAVGWVAAATAAPAQSLRTEDAPVGNFERCRAIPNPAARLRCFEDTPALAPKAQGAPGSWRLVRTPNPGGGRDAVSIMRTADITRSDLGLAGLMLRCGEGSTELLIVLVQPIPPRAHPKVVVSAGGKGAEFTASVVPPGVAVLLPQGASALAAGPWQSASELAVEVDDDQGPIRGIVSLAGLGAAFRTLLSSCPSP